MASVLGKQLVDMLDACTLMGAEAAVEVHTLGELENALSNAAPILIINMWDRLSGKYFADTVVCVISDSKLCLKSQYLYRRNICQQ